MRSVLKAARAALAILCFVASSGSQAALIEPLATRSAAPDRVDFVMPVLGPFAYTHFCLRYAQDCRIRGGARALVLTPARRHQLRAVNGRINRSIAPMRSVDDTTFDTWRIGPRQGDCNDYAVTKRHELLKQGWPSSAVLLSEVITPSGEHHLVLLVRTDHGNVVLDNLTAQIRPWRHTKYRWVRVQMPTEPSLWSTIRPPRRLART